MIVGEISVADQDCECCAEKDGVDDESHASSFFTTRSNISSSVERSRVEGEKLSS